MELWRDNEGGERTEFQVEFEQNMETRLEELAFAFRGHKSTNENQIGGLTNRLDQAFTEEKEKWQRGKSQNAEWQSKVFSQLRDDTSRYKSEAELSKPTASSKQQQAAALATTTLSESKQMGLDTVTISIATEEESTPVGLVIAAKDGAGSDQVCATTSSTAAGERRQVGLATVVRAADEAGKWRGVDTVGTQDAAGETCTSICPQTTYKTKMEEYKDEKVILKRQMQEMQVSSGTGLLDLEHSTRCRQLRSDFDTSAIRQERPHTRTQQSMQNRQNSSRMDEESEQEQDANALHQQLPWSLVCYKTNTLQSCLRKLFLQKAYWKEGVAVWGFVRCS
jgi:hypothetical protein